MCLALFARLERDLQNFQSISPSGLMLTLESLSAYYISIENCCQSTALSIQEALKNLQTLQSSDGLSHLSNLHLLANLAASQPKEPSQVITAKLVRKRRKTSRTSSSKDSSTASHKEKEMAS